MSKVKKENDGKLSLPFKPMRTWAVKREAGAYKLLRFSHDKDGKITSFETSDENFQPIILTMFEEEALEQAHEGLR